MRAAWNGYLGFSFSFPGYLEWQRPFRANLRVKKSLWKEILLILLWEFVGVQREFKGRLKNDYNLLMNLSLSFQFPCYSFLELSLMLQFTFLCLSFSISFWTHLQPSGRLKNLEHDHLPCFLHEAGCQCNYLRLLRCTLCMFFFFFSKSFSIFQQDSHPQSIVSICVKKKKAHRNCGLFSKCSGAGIGNATRSAEIACRAKSLFSSLPVLQNLSHKITY